MNMSERDDAQNQNVGELYQTFFEMVDRSAARDAGIALFEQLIEETETKLRTEWVGSVGISYEALREVQDKLNAAWSYSGDIATVTGKISAPSQLIDMVPEGFQELSERSEEDDEDYEGFEDDTISYFVENARLRSHGVEVMPMFDDEEVDGKVTNIKVSYLFSHEDDEMHREIYSMYVGESFDHHYENPTAVEAEVRLIARWPEQTALVARLIQPDVQTALPGRLNLICRRLQKDFAESDEFQRLMTIYVNDRIAFNKEQPYILTAQGSIDCYDGKDPRGDPDGAWVEVKLSSPFTVNAYSPEIEFSEQEDGTMRSDFIFQRFNDEDGDKPEYLAVTAENVIKFRSTRATRSLLGSALMVGDLLTGDPQVLEEDSIIEAPTEGIEAIEGPVWSFNGKEISRPEYVAPLELLESELKSIQNEIKLSTKKMYSSEEEAKAASIELLNKYVVPRLVGAGIASGHELEFIGANALKPNTLFNGEGTGDEKHTFKFAINPTEPYVEQDLNDSFTGIIQSMSPSTKSVTNAESEVLGYQAMPTFVVHYYGKTVSGLLHDGISLADINVQMRAVVPMDGSVEMKLTQLERYRKQIFSIQSASVLYGKDSIMQSIYQIRAGFKEKSDDEKTLFSGVETLKRLGVEFARLDESGIGSTAALDALSALMEEVDVKTEGNTLTREENGLLLQKVNEKLEGKIIDVRTDILKGDVVLALRIDWDTIKYVPLSSLKAIEA